MGVQATAGNSAVVQMLRQADGSGAQGDHQHIAVQRMQADADTASQSGNGSDMEIDTPPSPPFVTARADATRKAAVATKLNRVRFSSMRELGFLTGQVSTTGTERASRPRALNQLSEAAVLKMYAEIKDPTKASGYTCSEAMAPTVRAEVEALAEHLIHAMEARADGALFQSGKNDDGSLKKQALVHTSTDIAGRRGVELPSLALGDHVRPINALGGPPTPDQVTTPNGTLLDRVTTYTADKEDGSQHRYHAYAANAEAHKDVMAEATQTTGKAALGRGLTEFAGSTKVAGPIDIDETLLVQWSGIRGGWSPDQNGAMFGVSASTAAQKSGFSGDDWQWLHLIAFTMGGRNGTQPNEVGNLAAGLAAANGHHLVLESLVKKMASDKDITGVKVTATAHMIQNSFHVCRSIDYKIEWTKNGENIADTFHIGALDPNRSMGGHLEMLCKQYGIAV